MSLPPPPAGERVSVLLMPWQTALKLPVPWGPDKAGGSRLLPAALLEKGLGLGMPWDEPWGPAAVPCPGMSPEALLCPALG